MLDIKFYNSIKRKYPSLKICDYLYQNVGIDKIVGSVCCKHCHTYEVESDSLFLTNTKSGNLIDYKFYGNRKETIGKNLYDPYSVISYYPNCTLTYINNGFRVKGDSNEYPDYYLWSKGWVQLPFEFEEGVTYTISFDCIQITPGNINRVRLISSTSHEGIDYLDVSSTKTRVSSTFSLDEEEGITICLSSNELEITNIQIEKSSTVTSYEPYTKEIIRLGDKTKNLFTTDYYDYSSPGVVYESKGSNSFNQKGSSAWNSATFMIDGLTVGTKYTISCNATDTKYISIKDDSFNDVAESPGNITFTAPTDTVYISFYSSLGTAIEYDNTYSDIQLEKSETVTSFEPFGYKIPISTYGKNLLRNNFDMLPSIATEESDGTIILNGTLEENTWCGLRSLTLPPGTYTFSHNKTFNNESYFLVNNQSVSGNSLILTFTEKTTFVVGVVLIADTYNNESMKLQIETGSTATEYEQYKVPVVSNIYLNEPLVKIGSYSDYIDFQNQKVVRKIKHTILDGSTEIALSNWRNSNTSVGFITSYTDSIKSIDDHVIYVCCDKLPSQEYSDMYYMEVDSGIALTDGESFDFAVRLPDTTITSTSKILSWLTDNPLGVYYVVETPIEETITLPEIPTLDGSTNYIVNTEIQPSEVYVKYYSTERG